MPDCAAINTFEDFAGLIPTIKPKLLNMRIGFASNMIFMSRETFDQIGGGTRCSEDGSL